MRSFVFVRPEPLVSLVDGSQELIERRCFFDRPSPIECWTEQTHVMSRQQTDGHDAILHDTLRNLI